MRRSLCTAALGLLLAAAGTAPAAQAAWQDSATVSGTTLATVVPQAPVVTCQEFGVGEITVEWGTVPGATGYVMTDTWGTHHYGADETSQSYYVVGGATLTIRAKYGSWLSPPSNEVTWAIVLVGGASCS